MNNRWKLTLYVVWTTQIISIMSFSFGMPFMAYYIQELGMTDPDMVKLFTGILTAAPAITMGVMAPFWGRLADRIGKKPMLLRAMVAGAVVMFGLGMAQEIWHLVVFRFIQGAFTGTISAAAALVASTVPENRLSYSLGFLSSSSFIGSMVGPTVGGLVAEWFGYRPSFFIGAILMVIDVVLVTFLVQEPGGRPEEALGRLGARWRKPVADTGSAMAAESEDDSAVCIPMDSDGESAVCHPVPITAPRIPKRFANRKSTPADNAEGKDADAKPGFLLAGWFLMSMGLLLVLRITTGIFTPFLPIHIQNQLGLVGAAQTTGLFNGFVSLASALSGILLGRLGDRFDRVMLLRIYSFSGMILGLPLFWLAGRSIWFLMLGYGVMMFFVGGIEPIITSTNSSRIDRSQRGTLFGMQAMVSSIGWTIYPALGSFLSIRFSILSLLFVIPLLLALIWLVLMGFGRILKPSSENPGQA